MAEGGLGAGAVLQEVVDADAHVGGLDALAEHLGLEAQALGQRLAAALQVIGDVPPLFTLFHHRSKERPALALLRTTGFPVIMQDNVNIGGTSPIATRPLLPHVPYCHISEERPLLLPVPYCSPGGVLLGQ